MPDLKTGNGNPSAPLPQSQAMQADPTPMTALAASTDVPSPWHIRTMSFGLILLVVILIYLLLIFWPAGLDEKAKGSDWQTIYLFGQRGKILIKLDIQLMLLVIIAGGLGSFIHTATSYGDYVGNKHLARSWTLWYILRPFIGMTLALVFYFVIRGGFLSAGTSAGSINPFGIAALAGLVGLFSKQASDKLNEVFNTLFKTSQGEGDAKRKDSLTNPVPVLTDIEPKSSMLGVSGVSMKVRGSGFVRESAVKVNGTNRETVFENTTTLSTTLVESDLKEKGELTIAVTNPPPGGGDSTPLKFVIEEPKSTGNAVG